MPSPDKIHADSSKHYDVVVVGGGPSGSAAAFSAKALGLKVCVIDKANFPREKLCGGLVTPRSKRLHLDIFGQEIAENLLNHSDSISFFSEKKRLERIVGYKTLFFCMRYEFDHSLIVRCGDKGVDLFLGHSITNIDTTENCVYTDQGFSATYGVLIGADGANSQVAKAAFGSSFDQSTIGFGLEVEVPRAKLPDQGEDIEIDFAAARWGYGWVFPKRQSFTIGVGGIHRLNPDMKLRLEKYLSLKNLRSSDYKVKGQYIPFGDFRKTPGRGNLILVGDASGVVDPITGEGIAYAFETGSSAAKAAKAAIIANDEKSAFDRYRNDYARISSTIKQANRWRRLIFPKALQGVFNWAFSDASTLQRGYLDVLAGDADYSLLNRLFLVQAKKAISKPFRIVMSKIRT